MSKKAPRRGRPPVFKGNDLRRIVGLLKRTKSIKSTQEAIEADPLKGVVAAKGKNQVPSTVYLSKLAKAEKITLQRGRPVAEAA